MRTPYRIAIIGPAQTGKSSLLRALEPQKEDAKNECLATIGIDIRFINAANVKIQMTDTAGSERFRSIRQTCYKSADLFVIVVDNSDANTLKDDINTFLAEMEASNLTHSFKVGLVINFKDTLSLKPGDVNLPDELRRRFEFVEKVSVIKAETGLLIRQKLIEYAEALVATRTPSRTPSMLSTSTEETASMPVQHGSNASFSERIQQLRTHLPLMPSAQDICHGFGRLFSCCKRPGPNSEILEEDLLQRSPRS